MFCNIITASSFVLHVYFSLLLCQSQLDLNKVVVVVVVLVV